jgi:hypothetical protein
MPPKQIVFADLLKARKLRWPTKGDRLFAAAPPGTPEAEIHPDRFTRSVFMMDGYKLAADELVEIAISNHTKRGDLIYPIVFCYRQFLELSLKWQLATYGSFCGIPRPKERHKLRPLIEAFGQVCRAYGATDDEALIAVTECVLEFDRMDPGSLTFRYSADDKGTAYPVTADRIDLVRLKDVMNGIQGFFRGCDGYFNNVASPAPDSDHVSGF